MINDENKLNQLNINGAKNSKSKGKGKTIEETYTKKTQLEHILLRPDTYIGSVEKHSQSMWVLDKESNQMVFRPCTFVPGLYKIFDEIIVNAADNKQRDPKMNRIEVTISEEENYIRVWNNGNGIPVAIHQEHNIYVPELIFGNLLTGSNFDDEEQKTTGGRNGYGAKLANIFSTKFVVETADSSRLLKYRQEFLNNMSSRKEPEIKSHKGTDYTCITFYPDLSRFKMDCLDEDIVALLSKRVYDIAGTTNGSGTKLNVFLNGTKIEVKSFESYISLYKGMEPPVVMEKINDRWEVGVGISDGSFQQLSFVNSICTMKGGTHVNYITDQITSKLSGAVKKKNKGEEVKPNQIKNHLSIFVNSLIVNPSFDSQTKEFMTTKASAFGSSCSLTDKMLKQIEKSGIIDNILSWAKFKQNAELKKKSGTKKSKLMGITKLDDANYAGTAKSSKCTLILTEGDSAKALAISGLGVVGRDYYGVFPLKGKLLNVREASHQQIMKNEEIQNLTKILGLNFGKTYSDVSSLRYGHLMLMTDQDHDGSHIKGLLINFIHHFWPSLLKIDGFLKQFITPIVKCVKGKKSEVFYTIPQYKTWRQENDEGKGWRIKYYKGLGTSTSAEAKEYFSNLRTHEIPFEHDNQSDYAIDMAFSKKRVEDRKLWLLSKDPSVFMDYSVSKISYDAFVNRELILFSHADNERSIPHFMDGFKPSQRKVLFSCFKRNLKNEIKVAQLGGYIAEHSAYHHGENSLSQTIIGMAQNYVGSNNINLLTPCGQFGTRLMGGKDSASPRYVFTKLESITRAIFHADDDPLLDYQEEDGQIIEPTFYAPIIPMVLVNGSEGIGTGWSTSVPTYNPREIIENLRSMIIGNEPTEMYPWSRGFIGDIEEKHGRDAGNFAVYGVIEEVNDTTVHISELPVGKWTTDYKQFLESCLINNPGSKDENGVTPFIKDFKENHTDTTVSFTITMAPEKMEEIKNEKGGLIKKFKLEGSIATSNMNMFDLNGQIRKFESPTNIIKEFFNIRIQFYDKRKIHLTNKLNEEWEMLDNKMRFILDVVNGKLVVSNRKKAELLQDIKSRGFKAFYPKKASYNDNDSTDEEEEELTNTSSKGLDKGYDYLLSMKIWNLTMEKVQDLIDQRNKKKDELELLKSKSAESMWLEDLDNLEAALSEFESAFGPVKQASSKRVMRPPPAAKPIKKVLKESKEDVIRLDADEEVAMDLVEEKVSVPTKKVSSKGKVATTKSSMTKNVTQIKAEKVEEDREIVSLFDRLKAKRQDLANSKPISANFEVDEEDDIIDSDDESPAASSSSSAPQDSLLSLLSTKPKGKAAPAAKKNAKATTSKATTASAKGTAAKTTTEAKGRKRVAKSSTTLNDKESAYSPVASTPKPVKKVRTNAKTANATKKALFMKKGSVSDDDESEFDDEEDVQPKKSLLSKKSPKPTRQRKQTNYNKYYDDLDELSDFIEEDSEEEEEEEDFSDEEDDDEDFSD